VVQGAEVSEPENLGEDAIPGIASPTANASPAASSDDASLFETKVAAAPGSRTSDSDMINEVKLQNPAGFADPTCEAKIGFGRGRVSGGMIMHHDEGIGRMSDYRLKNFARMGGSFVESTLADGSDLDQVLLRVKENDPERFAIEEAHFGTKVCNR